MTNHFALSRASRDLDLDRIDRRSDAEVYDAFLARRYAATGGKLVCPHCKGQKVCKLKSRQMLKCSPCNRQFSPRQGTGYYKSKLSIYNIDKAVARFCLDAKGVSALELSHKMNVQYKTAHKLLQKFRNAILPGASLERFVEDVKTKTQEGFRDGMQFDGAEFGGFIRPKNVKKTEKDHRRVPYRSKEKEQAVAIVEPGGRVRVGVFKSEGASVDLVRRSAKKDTVAFSDKGTHWYDLHLRFDLRQVNHSTEYANADSNINATESLWSLARKGESGVHHHISGVHLLSYLGEIAWRRENNRATDREKYTKMLDLLQRPIPKSPKFNRNVKRKMKKEGNAKEYFALREVAAAQARALAFAA